MYIAVAEHKINNYDIIQLKVSSFLFIVIILNRCLPEAIAKTKPFPIHNLVTESILQTVMYILLLVLRFTLKLSPFFSNITQGRYYIYIYMVLVLHMIFIATYVF